MIRPDITEMVDWALKKQLPIPTYLIISNYGVAKLEQFIFHCFVCRALTLFCVEKNISQMFFIVLIIIINNKYIFI